MSGLLENINSPADLKGLSGEELVRLSTEIRERILRTVSMTGGHLAANLGAVELTVAMLNVFDPPTDRIVWDTGHQTYAFKMLTGRRDRIATLRQYGGLSGFLSRAESEYDAFGAGHAGTALSAALGMAVARDRRGQNHHVMAVLGDASAGCGISFEAMNSVQTTAKRLIVVLNDNEMSISANVGALSRYMGGLLANPRYNRWKRSVEHIARRMHMGPFRKMYYRIEESMKSFFLDNIIFEEFGLRYVGPINGHNIYALVDAMQIARDAAKPILLHVSTTKGKGYEPAEQQPERWHGTPTFDLCSGERESGAGNGKSYSAVFGETLEALAERDERVVAITAAMPSGTGLTGFARRFPGRFFDVGIAEEHAVVFAAGLATEGFTPVFAVYSTFLQRAVDCVIHDVCLQRLPVVLCLDRAGAVGDDGPTHHGVFDLALLRPVPGLVIMQPRNEAELADMLYTAVRLGKPAVIRYPRGTGPGVDVPEERTALPIGKAEVLRAGRDVALWALGDMLGLAEQTAELLAAQDVSVSVVNARFAKPIDAELLREQAGTCRVMATFENGVVTGGFGAGVRDGLREQGLAVPVCVFGWPDRFVPHGNTARLMRDAGLTPEAAAARIRASL